MKQPLESGYPSRAMGKGCAFGTFGELMQGMEASGRNFLVTFPIDRFAHATFCSDPDATGVDVFPPHKKKARQLAANLLAHWQLPGGGRLELVSELPVGKGLASSSADLVATARALADCFGLALSNEVLQAFIREIEPTDGVMYDGIVSFYHREVELREELGTLPPLTVVALDEGGEVDTVEFNKLPKPFTDEERSEYADLLDRLSAAVRDRDISTIGDIATRSAVLNQKLRPKRTLDEMIALAEEIGALGVIVAHSGTTLGVLLSPEDCGYEQQVVKAQERLLTLGGDVSLYHGWQPEPQNDRSTVTTMR
ncbi:MAG TPA: kinase [Bacilli bacterium]|nr:kinase [Bacilli bacterium]